MKKESPQMLSATLEPSTNEETSSNSDSATSVLGMAIVLLSILASFLWWMH